ncbi:hypothetical protein GCM10010329_66030 [Streptomyces spiroverticillatus]|nr:serine/threonine-protein kinase [Streptomyces finlayi]GHA33783.1 hypothetical protein GCM10010329_66030 [Streptomyces spiroverticillatus]
MEALTNSDPARIGPYRLLGKLGAGGMGQVYLARSEGGRTVAVKLVRAELAAEPEFRRRFAQEVAAARRVGGEWTAPVLDADTEAREPWVATGYVPGPTLHEAVVRNGRALPESSVRVLANRLAQGLAAIHRAGLIHRDLKPGNVLVTIDGPLVIDFGIARALDAVSGTGKLTRTGAVVGSPGFMSPEQVRGEPLTAASDVFCLGSVLAFAATGRAPFGGGESGMHGVMFRIAQEEPDLTGVPEGLLPLVRDCLAKDAAGRPTPEQVAERTADAVPDEGSGSDSDEPWLPAALVAQLGRHAAQLLDAETPAGMAQPPMPAGPPTGVPGAGGFGAGAAGFGAGAFGPAPGAPAPLSATPPPSVPPRPTGAPAPTPLPGAATPVPAMPSGPPTPLPGTHEAGGTAAPEDGPAPASNPVPESSPVPESGPAPASTPAPASGPVPTTPSPSPTPPGFGPPPPGFGGTPPGFGGTPPGGSTPLGGYGGTPPVGYGSTPPGSDTPPQGSTPPSGFGPAVSISPTGTPPATGAKPKTRKPLLVAVGTVVALAVAAGGILIGTDLLKGKDTDKAQTGGAASGSSAKGKQTPAPNPPPADTGTTGRPTTPATPTTPPTAAGAVPAGYLGIWQGEVKKSDGSVESVRRFTIKQGAEGEEIIDTVNSADKTLCEGVSTLVSAGNLLEVDTKRVVKSLPEADDCSPSGKQTLRLRPDGTVVWTDSDGSNTAVLRKVPPMAKEAVPAPLTATWKRTYKSEDGATHNMVLKISQGTYGDVVMRTTGDGDNYHCEWESSLVSTGTNTMRLAPSLVTASEPKDHCKSGDSSTELLELRGAQLIITQATASSDAEPASYRRAG